MKVMSDAYAPCSNFGSCRQAQWAPERGQIPRGFIGATGSLDDVEVVMIFAEPGHPHADEKHDATDAKGLLLSGMRHVYQCYKERTDPFHANVRWFMAQLYPDLTFDQQLRHIWLTEGRLCSVDVEIGGFRDKTCASHYLVRQLSLLPNATVVAFGGKAQGYLRGLNVNRIDAYAMAPPGCNHTPARPSWNAAIEAIQEKRRKI
jgi:hypothetical protein